MDGKKSLSRVAVSCVSVADTLTGHTVTSVAAWVPNIPRLADPALPALGVVLTLDAGVKSVRPCTVTVAVTDAFQFTVRPSPAKVT